MLGPLSMILGVVTWFLLIFIGMMAFELHMHYEKLSEFWQLITGSLALMLLCGSGSIYYVLLKKCGLHDYDDDFWPEG